MARHKKSESGEKGAVKPQSGAHLPTALPSANPDAASKENTPSNLPYIDPKGRPPSPFNTNVPACGAKTRSGGSCKNPSLIGVDGTFTRCKLHGGLSTGPIRHGQYSKLAGRRIQEVAEDLKNDEALTSIETQVKIAAALFMEKLDQMDKADVEELNAVQLESVFKMVEKLSKLIETRHRIREGQKYTIKIEHLQYVIVGVSDAINRVLADEPQLRGRLAKEIEGIRILEG